MGIREKILPFIPYAILAIGVAIFALMFYAMQPGNFSEHSILDLMTKAEKKHWLKTYDLINATCWVMAYIALYMGTFFFKSGIGLLSRVIFSIIYWAALMNLLDEKIWGNTEVHMDEYYFFIIITIHGAIYYYLRQNNVKRKDI